MNSIIEVTKTPVGPFYMIIDKNESVIKSGFGETPPVLPTIKSHRYIKLIHKYFEGDKNALSKIPFIQVSSDFTQRIWREIAKIPYGKTSNYKELALKSGNIKAVRAAGSACGKNQIPLIVPCHRIIKSDGSLGKYAYGIGLKAKLLELEGIKLN